MIRWRIKASLETLSLLRIGDGGWLQGRINSGEGDEEPPEVATVFLDADSKPVLPGTSLKGWLRAYAENRSGEDGGDIEKLFGSKDNGGMLRIFDGKHVSDPERQKLEGGAGVYWDSSRHTCVASHVTIDRRTGAAAPEKLFFEEYVPEGTKFDLEFELRNGDRQLAAKFLWLLKQFEAEDGGPARLGAGSGDDAGRVKLSGISVESISPKELGGWLRQDSFNKPKFRLWTPEETNRLTAEAVVPEAGGARKATWRVAMEFQGAFVSQDPSRARKRGDEESEEGNLTPLRLPEAGGPIPHLPFSSLRGGLRSCAEKIRRTMLGAEADREVSSPSARKGELETPTIQSVKDLPALDVVSVLFGAAGWRSPVRFSQQKVARAGDLLTQELIAIDRFTGGGAPHPEVSRPIFLETADRGTTRDRLRRDRESGAWRRGQAQRRLATAGSHFAGLERRADHARRGGE